MNESDQTFVEKEEQINLQEFKLGIFHEVAHSFGFNDSNNENLEMLAKKLAISLAELHLKDKPAYDNFIKSMDEKIQLSNIGLDAHHIVIAFAQPESPMVHKVDNALSIIFGDSENHEPIDLPVIILDEETGIYRPRHNPPRR